MMPAAQEDQSPSGLSNPPNALGPQKRKRNARACDRCHKNASKCSPSGDGSTCTRCAENSVTCTYNRPVKRRGPPSRRARLSEAQQPANPISPDEIPGSHEPSPAATPHGTTGLILPPLEDNVSASFYLAYKDTLTPETIESLVDVFFHVGYPLRPYFHWPTYRAQIQDQAYRSDWGIFIVTMAVCALAAGRLHDGSAGSSDPHPLRFQAVQLSSDCYNAAIDAMPRDITKVSEWYPLMKAKALLASACLQNGEIKTAVAHGGDYVSLSMSRGFHDEANWPSNLNEREKQERRRLFWGVYQHDQHMANSFSFLSRQRETKAAVQYPTEVYEDSDITEYGVRQRGDKVSFLRGWNFCTDLYRILEHMDGLIRPGRQIPIKEPGGQVTSFLSQRMPPKNFASDSLRLISQLYDELPADLKKIKSMTGDPHQDRYGFIASNILITTQTLKMVLVGSEKPSVHMRCAIATELLDELSAVPLAFFHASSTVTLHHLAQVGHMLAGVIQHPVSAWTYLQVRNILLVLAEFLTKIESSRSSTPGLAVKLRGQISRIDQCMQQLSQQNSEPGLLSIGRTLLSNNSDMSTLRSPDNSTTGDMAATQGHPGTHQAAGNIPTTLDQLPQHQMLATNPQPPSYPSRSQENRHASSLHTSHNHSNHNTDVPFGNAFDFIQPDSSQPPLTDSGMLSSNQYVLPSDLFDNWPFFLGQTDTYEPVDSFLFPSGGRRHDNSMLNGQ